MAFTRRSRPVARQGRATRLWGLCRDLLLLSARAVLTVGALAGLAAGIIYGRLLQGPIELPGLAQMLARQVSEANDQVRLQVGTVVLTLGEGTATSGLQFRDVELRAPGGQQLLAAQRVAARFHLSDLLHGRLQPVRITLIEPDAQLIRTADGGLRFGMGNGAGVALPKGKGDGFALVARLIDGVVGDLPPVPELAKLDRIEILGANLTFDDRRSGSHWRTHHADLRLWRHPGGARGSLDLRPMRAAGAALGLTADRPAGLGRTDLRLQFANLDAARLAAQARQLDCLRLIGGTVDGEASVTLERDGALRALDGVILARDGVLHGLGDPVHFDAAELHFGSDPARDRLEVERFRLSAPGISATLAGHADLLRGPGGEMRALAGQFAIGGLHVDMPDRFDAPLTFDGGNLTAHWSLPERRIEVAQARLTRGALVLALSGEAVSGPQGWRARLDAEAAGMSTVDLLALWPADRAVNARGWVDRHVTEGQLDRVVARVAVSPEGPEVALGFDFSGLRVNYLDGMSPVEAARGRGRLTHDDLHIEVDEGRLAPAAGPIMLAGSTVAIRDFRGEPPAAEIAVRGDGAIAAVMAVIDQPPLRLLSRGERQLDAVDGRAAVEVDLVIPLLSRLRLADIGVDARAVLSNVSTRFPVSAERSVTVVADRLALAADPAGLRVHGSSRIEGAPVALDWREEFGPGRDGRRIDLAGKAGGALLAAIGAGDLPVEGMPPFTLSLRQDQAGGASLAFDLAADLGPAGLAIPALNWTKAPGVPASLRAQGSRSDGVEFSSLALASPGLDLSGSLRLDRQGRLVRAAFDQIRLPGTGTLSATAALAPDDVLEIALRGRRLDLSDRVNRGAGAPQHAASTEPVRPVRLGIEVEELVLGERIALAPARGVVEQHASGTVEGHFDGQLGAAPVTLHFDMPDVGPGTMRLVSADAGSALRAAGFYSGAEGGRLTLTAQTGAGRGLSGEARIEDVQVRSQATFRTMLRDGGLESAEQAVSGGGIGFRKVVVPFAYREGRLHLTNAIASSPMLALKVNGTVDERTDQVDLSGVLSPAYGLTGALNEVPLLGQILGGKGEGVLAMTFRMRGPVKDPRFSVNPLSMLAPGFLRKIFSMPAGEVSAGFRDGITPPNR